MSKISLETIKKLIKEKKFVVTRTGGSSDGSDLPIRDFDNKEDAEEFVKKMNAKVKGNRYKIK